MKPVRDVVMIALLTGALATGTQACADDGLFRPEAIGITAGYTRGADVAIYAAQARWRLPARRDWLARHYLDVRAEAQVAYWQGRGTPTPYGHLWDFSVQPILRWTPPVSASLDWFVEGGIGLHILSATRINSDRQLGTAVQFGEMIAAGVAFGRHREYEIALYFQHVSNANLDRDANWGLSYPGVVFRMAFPSREDG